MMRYIQIHRKDNVCIALCDLLKGESISLQKQEINLIEDIAQGHKISLADIPKGELVVKYGFPIGKAKQDIKQGEWVHTHNLATGLDENLTYSYQPQKEDLNIPRESMTFNGYQRDNSDVGIRNELWVIPTVGCVNGQAKQIVKILQAEGDISHIDAIEVLSHQYGCSQLGDDHQNTQKAIAAAIKHPNAGGVLVLGLGCENNQISSLKEHLGEYDKKRVRFITAQEVEDEVELGLEVVKELSEVMKADHRTEVSISKLRIGLKCGGSDGFSGITANPLLGTFSDWLVAQGGSTILTEVPEMFGAETTLMDRAEDEKVFTKTVDLINGFKDYFRQNNQVIYENPSPGNKAGGITTLEEKSLGATQKGGLATVVDVLDYGSKIAKPGLNLLWSPGNDLVASSALAMSGCQMVIFTTGRGTPFGSFVPTMKVSTNSALYNKKKNWMDFNAGVLLEGQTMEDIRKSFTDYVVAVANGAQLKHELAEFKEIAIFKSGVTL